MIGVAVEYFNAFGQKRLLEKFNASSSPDFHEGDKRHINYKVRSLFWDSLGSVLKLMCVLHKVYYSVYQLRYGEFGEDRIQSDNQCTLLLVRIRFSLALS